MLFLDSADIADIERATTLGIARGITMNPRLMRAHTADPLKHLGVVLEATEANTVMYQPTGSYRSLLDEALVAYQLDPTRIVIKIAAATTHLPVASRLRQRKVPVALTGVVTASQLLAAETVGASHVIAYVDRAARDKRTSSRLVRELAELRGTDITIVAASVKSAGQALQSRLDGADIITAPMDVLVDTVEHPATNEAVHAFELCATKTTKGDELDDPQPAG